MLQSLITAGVAIIAIIISAIQIGRARFQQTVDALFRLEDIFFGRLKLERSKAARGILAKNFSDTEPILDQFETIALLLRRRALDREMVWHTFFYWMNNYFEACAEYIQQRQQQNPNLWQDLSRLVPELREFEARQRGVATAKVRPNEAEIRTFLDEEMEEGSTVS